LSGQLVSEQSQKLFVLLLTVGFGVENEFPGLLGEQADKGKVIATEAAGRPRGGFVQGNVFELGGVKSFLKRAEQTTSGGQSSSCL